MNLENKNKIEKLINIIKDSEVKTNSEIISLFVKLYKLNYSLDKFEEKIIIKSIFFFREIRDFKIIKRLFKHINRMNKNRINYDDKVSKFNNKKININYCYVCDRFFSKRFYYIQHLRMHYNLKIYKCKSCNIFFSQLNGLNYHYKKCKNKKNIKKKKINLNYEYCETCGRMYLNGSQLRNHIIRFHSFRNSDLGLTKSKLNIFKNILCNFLF